MAEQAAVTEEEAAAAAVADHLAACAAHGRLPVRPSSLDLGRTLTDRRNLLPASHRTLGRPTSHLSRNPSPRASTSRALRARVPLAPSARPRFTQPSPPCTPSSRPRPLPAHRHASLSRSIHRLRPAARVLARAQLIDAGRPRPHEASLFFPLCPTRSRSDSPKLTAYMSSLTCPHPVRGVDCCPQRRGAREGRGRRAQQCGVGAWAATRATSPDAPLGSLPRGYAV